MTNEEMIKEVAIRTLNNSKGKYIILSKSFYKKLVEYIEECIKQKTENEQLKEENQSLSASFEYLNDDRNLCWDAHTNYLKMNMELEEEYTKLLSKAKDSEKLLIDQLNRVNESNSVLFKENLELKEKLFARTFDIEIEQLKDKVLITETQRDLNMCDAAGLHEENEHLKAELEQLVKLQNMERLTVRSEDKNSSMVWMKHGEYVKEPCETDYHDVGELLRRLAIYEDFAEHVVKERLNSEVIR